MDFAFLRARVSLTAASIVAGLALSACGGGGGGTPTGSSLPLGSQSAAHGTHAAISTMRGATARIQKIDAAQSSKRKAQAVIGSGNVATADPPVPRPNEQPCSVTLFSNYSFSDFSQHLFTYTPSTACPGPWAKVVFEGDFNVTAGRQFDRTASVWVAGTNIYFGTTAEPSASLGPSWHVERDVTDLTPIFEKGSTGQVILGNTVNSTYTSIIYGTGTLQFYPANGHYPAPRTPDAVYPLSAGPQGGNQSLDTQQQALTATNTFPTNVERVDLDVFMESQIGDEFWYTCFPNDLASQLNNCGNTAFREGDVAVDGQAAGVAPVYPWIFTGGIDPWLWKPIPGVDTLNFKPYRVNLTPFAGLLDNGLPHTVTVNVFNNGNYFDTNGALLVYLDHGSSHVHGGIIANNTSLYPTPSVTEGVTFDSQGNARGPIGVTSTHRVSISGYVDTSHGRVVTDVEQQIRFSNQQQVVSTATQFQQNIQQDTNVVSHVTTSGRGEDPGAEYTWRDWPFTLDYNYIVNADGSATQTTSVSQVKNELESGQGGGDRPFRSWLSNSVTTSDMITFATDGTYAPSNGKSSQRYIQGNSDGYCYAKTIASKTYAVTSQGGGSCNPPF